jgi:tetratricopeptide (TPR) repeat protein
VALVGALAIVPYLNAVANDFVLDDVAIVAENPTIRDLGNVGRIFGTDYWGTTGRATAIIDPGLYRPLTILSYAVDYRLWQLRPAGYHVVNIVLHAAASVVVFLLCADLLGSLIAGAVAAAIFAVHPVHAEAVTGIVGRAEILATLFFLLAFRRARSAPSAPPAGAAPPPWRATLVSAGLYFLGLLSKETAVTLPAVLFVDDWLRRREPRVTEGRPWLRDAGIRYLALGVALAIYVVLRQQVVTGRAQMWPGFVGVPAWLRVLTAIRVLTEYVGLFVFPRTLSADYWKSDVPIAGSLFDGPVLLSLGLWAALVAVAWWRLRDQRAFLLGVAWFLMTILPASNLFFGSGVGKAERILYLPSVGLCLVVGWIALRVETATARRRVLLPLVAAPLVLALAARTYRRNIDWKDNLTLATATLSSSPQSPLMNTIAAEALVKRGEAQRAVALLQTALQQAPDMPGLHTHLGAAYFAQGLIPQAIDEYRRALRVNPSDTDALNNLGIGYLDTQQNDSAIAVLEAFLRLKPNDARAENNLGVAYFRLGQLERAADHYRRALQIQPDYSRARINLDRVLLQQAQAKK